jgi:hypothetical protein
MAQTAYERGTLFTSLDLTIEDTDPGAPVVPSPSVPVNGDDIALAPYMGGLLPRRIAWFVNLGTPGSLSAVQVDLQGSLDGTNWFQIDTYSTVADTLRFVVDKPVRFLRAVLVSFTVDNNASSTLQVGVSL